MYPGGCRTDIPKYPLRPHSLERLAHHPVQHIAGARRAPTRSTHCGRPPGARPFCTLCFLCRDSLRGSKSLMNLDCRFMVVWPQRQTFVRILLQLQNRSLLRADVRRMRTANPAWTLSMRSRSSAPSMALASNASNQSGRKDQCAANTTKRTTSSRRDGGARPGGRRRGGRGRRGGGGGVAVF